MDREILFAKTLEKVKKQGIMQERTRELHFAKAVGRRVCGAWLGKGPVGIGDRLFGEA